ncbi:Phenolic glucoside malonyltransferase 2 [Dichanthelium oligosanthes]|uniref:Phenolic glucoside malonyltransferase 2 n=1 Tax=Dichanthelium oligosanthes TaxID=888268 RepID=A0A1E5VLS2_9POAL|nr:Phenolic glucoside malonyltransferase 2 [Dichanthelium oligosanthes]
MVPVGSNDLPPQLHVVDTALVAPAAPALPPRSLPLTFFDVKWLHLAPVERVFLYRLPPDADVAAILSALRTSLSQALRAFYPLAGHVRITANKRHHELVYCPGDAVPFTTAEYDVDIDDLASDGPVRVATLAPLVPQLPKGRAVLAVQATLLLRGLAVGVTVHHSACDGASSMHFLRTWAAAACAGAGGADHQLSPPPPVIDRTLITDPRGLYDIYLKKLPPMITDDGFEFISKPPSSFEDRIMATFTLPQNLLQSIKDAVTSEAARRGITPPPRCSSMLAAYGFIWSCYCRAMRAGGTTRGGRDETSHFLFSVDQRPRQMKTAIPGTYFGNCLCPAIAAAPEEELAAAGVGGLLAACAAVAAAVEEEVGEGAQDRWAGCVDRVKEAVARGTLFVAGSPRFRVYDVDFGLGRPAKVVIVSAAKGGAMPVADARGGGGGVEVGVSLPAATGDMERFQKSFADGIAWVCSSIDHPIQQ